MIACFRDNGNSQSAAQTLVSNDWLVAVRLFAVLQASPSVGCEGRRRVQEGGRML